MSLIESAPEVNPTGAQRSPFTLVFVIAIKLPISPHNVLVRASPSGAVYTHSPLPPPHDLCGMFHQSEKMSF
jgi:hypothetical protein